MKPGDLIKYRNTNRIPAPLLGIILNEEPHAVEHRFFNVVLQNGAVKLISDHYLELILEKGT